MRGFNYVANGPHEPLNASLSSLVSPFIVCVTFTQATTPDLLLSYIKEPTQAVCSSASRDRHVSPVAYRAVDRTVRTT